MSAALRPQNLPETLVWGYIVGTYGIYYLGAQFVLAPLLGLGLAGYWAWIWWHQPYQDHLPPIRPLSKLAWLWIGCSLVIALALMVGHVNFDHGLSQIVKSLLNRWFRTWALFPLFIIAGHLPIRPQIVYQAIGILCAQSLLFACIGALVITLRLPNIYFTSPLQVMGGGDFYTVTLYGTITDNGQRRLQLFAPWAPVLGQLGCLYFFLAREAVVKHWRWLGMAGTIAMVIGSLSRLAVVTLPGVVVGLWLLVRVNSPWMQVAMGFGVSLAGIAAAPLLQAYSRFREEVTRFRPGSSTVRMNLNRLGLERWRVDAPIWGHGFIADEGPKVVAGMPIGTHQTWIGLLYVHGLVGCLAFGAAMVISTVYLLIRAFKTKLGQIAFAQIAVLLIFSLAENLETAAYIYWPSLLILGMAFAEPAPILTKDNTTEPKPSLITPTNIHA